MSGPPYPPTPITGSNAIGSFQIGVSPIGTIPPFNFWDTITSQFANSPIITQLISNMDQYIDQTQNFDAFFDNIFNVQTAQGYGLDVWGRRVGVQRTLNIVNAGKYFGYEEAVTVAPPGVDPFVDPYNAASPYYTGGTLTTSFQLADSSFRTLIFAKMLANISNGSSAAINQLLLNLFPNRGNCYVVDGLNMTMSYTFAFNLTPVELAILEQSGVLPKPVGVKATVVVL